MNRRVSGLSGIIFLRNILSVRYVPYCTGSVERIENFIHIGNIRYLVPYRSFLVRIERSYTYCTSYSTYVVSNRTQYGDIIIQNRYVRYGTSNGTLFFSYTPVPYCTVAKEVL